MWAPGFGMFRNFRELLNVLMLLKVQGFQLRVRRRTSTHSVMFGLEGSNMFQSGVWIGEFQVEFWFWRFQVEVSFGCSRFWRCFGLSNRYHLYRSLQTSTLHFGQAVWFKGIPRNDFVDQCRDSIHDRMINEWLYIAIARDCCVRMQSTYMYFCIHMNVYLLVMQSFVASTL